MSPVLAPQQAPPYLHLERLTTEHGLFEHADHDAPRIEHGYCVDDVARALVVAVRETDPPSGLAAMTERYLGFVESAVAADGRVHNRMDAAGRWIDEPTIGDWWGRALMGLGFAAAHAREPFSRTRATYAFLRAAQRRSPDSRASAFAVLGAAELVRAQPEAEGARRLLADAVERIPREPVGAWTWPEARLRYANATLCEALIAAGDVLARPELRARGLELLAFLLELETDADGLLSCTGSAGRGPTDPAPRGDQQGIEPAALADACARAFHLTGDPRWRAGVRSAWGWFLGENDRGIPMYDPETGAGFDGLTASGRNANRGAESTLAVLSTWQQLRAVEGAPG